MTEGRQALLIMRGTVAELPQEDQTQIAVCLEKMKTVMVEGGVAGNVAAALLALELAAAADEC